MINFWILSVLIFVVSTLLLSKLTLRKYRMETGEKMWKNFGSSTHFWKLLLLCSLGITALILFILKWSHVVNF
ncbi:hypothetical protein [Flavobacterium sp.]